MRARRSEGGQTLPLVALCVVTLMVAAALGIDIGSLAATNRRLQAVADLAAIDGARELTGTSCDDTYVLPTDSTTVPSTQYDHVAKGVTASAARNGFVPGGTKTLTIELGFVTRDTNGVPTFNPLSGCGADVPDAVRVRAGDQTAFSFGTVVGQSGRSSNRFAVGTLDGRAWFKVGSSVATVDTTRSALLNPILSQMFCRSPLPTCNLNLTAAGYNGLLVSDITFGELAAALNFATTEELLTSDVKIDDILTASALLVDPNMTGAATVTSALATLTAAVSSSATVRLMDMVSADLQDGNSAANVGLNLFELVTSSATIFNGTHAVSIPNTVVTIPGVSSVTASVSLIEAPIRIGSRAGASGQTKQLEIVLTPVINLSSGTLAGLNLASVTGSLPITIKAGAATGTLERVRCGTDRGIDTNILVNAASIATQGSLNISLGTSSNSSLLTGLLTNLLNPVLGGRTVTTSLTISPAGASTAQTNHSVTFADPADFQPPTTEHVGNTTIGLDDITYGSATLNMTVPLTLGTTTVSLAVNASAIAALLAPVLGQVDTLLVQPLLDVLGADFGAADVTPIGMQCGVPGLAG